MAEIVVKSEIAGTVWQIEAEAGAALQEQDAILILESMKMEIPVVAPAAATVRKILVSNGDAVKEGQPLAILEQG